MRLPQGWLHYARDLRIFGSTLSLMVGGALAGWAMALIVAGALYLLSRGGREPNDWTYWTYAVLPTLSVLGIGWGAWMGWLVRSGVRPVVLKLVLPGLVSVPVLLYLAYITGLPSDLP